METKEALINNVNNSFEMIHQWFADQSDELYAFCPEGKWSSGQHLVHLTKSNIMLNKVLNIPKFILRWKFGKPNRPPRNYDKLVQRYLEKYALGMTASSSFIAEEPPPVHLKQDHVNDYLIQRDRLIKKIQKMNWESTNKYLLPHPLLGKITVREMLYFTTYHNLHHLEVLKEKYPLSVS